IVPSVEILFTRSILAGSPSPLNPSIFPSQRPITQRLGVCCAPAPWYPRRRNKVRTESMDCFMFISTNTWLSTLQLLTGGLIAACVVQLSIITIKHSYGCHPGNIVAPSQVMREEPTKFDLMTDPRRQSLQRTMK